VLQKICIKLYQMKPQWRSECLSLVRSRWDKSMRRFGRIGSQPSLTYPLPAQIRPALANVNCSVWRNRGQQTLILLISNWKRAPFVKMTYLAFVVYSDCVVKIKLRIILKKQFIFSWEWKRVCKLNWKRSNWQMTKFTACLLFCFQ
jgi:hypothetical protein